MDLKDSSNRKNKLRGTSKNMAKTKFEVYKDNKGNYRWRLLAQNGEPVASSGEGFVEKRTAMNAVKKLKDWSNTETIIDLEKLKEEAMKQKEKDAKVKAIAKEVSAKKAAPAKKTTPKKVATKKAASKKVAPKKAVVKTAEVKEVIVSKTLL